MNELAPARTNQSGSSGNRLSILEMINFSLSDFLSAYRFLVQERDVALQMRADGDSLRNVRFAANKLRRFGSRELHNRLSACVFHLSQHPVDSRLVAYELGIALQAIEREAEVESFFRYYPADASRLEAIPYEWNAVYDAFFVENEIKAAIDCFALHHFDGCVFYMMRVAESGLRALANERGVKLAKDKLIEYAQWQEILTALDAKVKEIGRGAKAGPRKDEALEFYGSALADFTLLKDRFRNRVMHVRLNSECDHQDALDAIDVTKRLMNKLATKIKHETKKPINWKF